MASFLIRQWRTGKKYVVRNSGTLARGTITALAATTATAACVGALGPGAIACGVAAAQLTDAALGGVVERNTNKLVQGTIDRAQDYFDDPASVPAPPGLTTSLSGFPRTITSLSDKPISKWSAESLAAQDAAVANKKEREISLSRSRTIKAALSVGALGLGAIALIKRRK